MIRVVWSIVGMPLSIPELKWMLIGQRLGDGFTMSRDLYDYTGPVAVFFYKWLDIFFGRSRWVHVIFSTLLIILQAGLFNRMLIRNKAYAENNYLPAFLYVTCMSATMDFFALSPQLIAVTFILMALNHVFRRIDNVVTDELFLYSGLYLGLAMLCYLPSAIYFLIVLLSLVLFSSAVTRRMLLFIYGAGVVLLVVWAYYFWFDANGDFLYDFFLTPFLKEKTWYINLLDLTKVGGMLAVTMLFGVSVVFTQRVTNFQQKMQQVMLLFIAAGGVVLMLNAELTTADLVFFVPSITFFLTYYFLGLRRRFWTVFVPYALVIVMIIYPYFWLKSEELNGIIVGAASEPQDRTLMGIGLEIADYQNNPIGGPFLDPFVSARKIEQLDYFDGVSGLYHGIVKSQPDLIIDREGEVASKLFHRFPDFGEHYQQTAPEEYTRVSN